VAEEVKTTEPPPHIVGDPDVVIVGTLVGETTVTVTGLDGTEVQPVKIRRTEYVPLPITVMALAVEPLLQMFPKEKEDVNTTVPPSQKVVGPPAEILGINTSNIFTVKVSFTTQPLENVL